MNLGRLKPKKLSKEEESVERHQMAFFARSVVFYCMVYVLGIAYVLGKTITLEPQSPVIGILLLSALAFLLISDVRSYFSSRKKKNKEESNESPVS